MDECTNALDKNTELKIIKKLINLEKTIFMITHNLIILNYLIRYCISLKTK